MMMSRRLICFVWLCALSAQITAQSLPPGGMRAPDPSRRYQVFETRAPHDLICQITVAKKNTALHATAFLVSGNVLVSAGHVFRESLFSKITALTLCVGRHNTDSGNRWLLTRTYNRAQLRIQKNHGFIGRRAPSHDYTFLALPENISSSFFQLGEFNHLPTSPDSLFITGYPEDKGYTGMWQKGDRPINIVEKNHLLLYSIYTWLGDSGAPVWCNNGGQYYAVGIHNISNYQNIHRNAGVKFTGKILGRLQSFISRYAIPLK